MQTSAIISNAPDGGVTVWPKSILLPICVILSLSGPRAPGQATQHEKGEHHLIFEAQPTRQSFRMGNPISLRVELENVSSQNVLVKRRFRFNDTVSLKITGPHGRSVPTCGVIPDWADLPGDFVLLAPRAHVEGLIRVDCDNRPKEMWGYNFPGPGEYSITAIYELTYPVGVLKRAAGSAKVVKGPVVAKTIHLTILSRH